MSPYALSGKCGIEAPPVDSSVLTIDKMLREIVFYEVTGSAGATFAQLWVTSGSEVNRYIDNTFLQAYPKLTGSKMGKKDDFGNRD